jgi:BirA family biotin operon repressor/biotin-[acetyl-CoA-carboxylase] ligase
MSALLGPALEANVVWLTTVDSSNAMAERLMRAMADDEDRLPDTVIVADVQTEGHGREGRRWESPAGGLYATWLGWLTSESLARLPMAMGAILAEAVETVVPGVAVGLKWPNDLEVGGRKLGGILCQSRVAGEQVWAMAGFGINLEAVPALPPDDAARAVSLRSLGWLEPGDRAKWNLIGAVASGVRPALAHPVAVREAWIRRSVHHAGEVMTIRNGALLVEGTFVGFGEDGQLVVDVDGTSRSFGAGELVRPVD